MASENEVLHALAELAVGRFHDAYEAFESNPTGDNGVRLAEALQVAQAHVVHLLDREPSSARAEAIGQIHADTVALVGDSETEAVG